MSGSEIALTAICVVLIGLCGFIFWMWHQDKKLCHKNKTDEAKRLYAWLDDILDRIAADDAERYAFCRRVKFEIPKTPPPPTDIAKEDEKTDVLAQVQGRSRR